MTIQYILAPNGRWSAFDQTGFAAIGGKVYTYENATRIPRNTYQDPAGLYPNTNPVTLDSRGEANIYWANDDFYTIEVYSRTGELLYSQDNYPNVVSGSGGDIVVSELNFNLARNGQFTVWGNSDFLNDSDNVAFSRLGMDEIICNDWKFRRSNLNATMEISQQNFSKGQSEVPANPISYLNYECTNIGAGSETYKDIYQIYKSAQFLSNAECAFGIWANSTIANSIIVRIEQNFGTVGLPSATVVTEILNTALTTDWTQYTGFITVPSVAGKNFGTNGDDYIALVISLPLNAIANISLANVQFHGQNTLPNFPKLPANDQLKRMDSVIDEGVFTTGDYIFSIAQTKGNGWIICDDGTIGNSFSGSDRASNETFNLYKTLWSNIEEIYVPMFDSSGTPVSRGVDYISDWNADKRLSLTRNLGRVLGSTGTVSGSMRFTADVGTDALTVGYSSAFYTGTSVRLLTTGSLPSPLAVGTTYYAIKIDGVTLKIATTLSNALSGSAINITTTGSGINTIYLFNVNEGVIGRYSGEGSHALIVSEGPQHTHTAGNGGTPVETGIGPANLQGGAAFQAYSSSLNTSGSGTPHNNIQPILYTNCFFKL